MFPHGFFTADFFTRSYFPGDLLFSAPGGGGGPPIWHARLPQPTHLPPELVEPKPADKRKRRKREAELLALDMI